MAMARKEGRRGWVRARDGSGHPVEVVCRRRPVAPRKTELVWEHLDGTPIAEGLGVMATPAEVVGGKPKRTRKPRKVRATATTHAARTAPRED